MKSGLSIREKQGLERTRHRTSVDAGRRRKRSVMMSIGISAKKIRQGSEKLVLLFSF